MPTYDYKCEACGHTFEQFQAITDDPLTECPECGGEVRRLIGSGGAVIFKGSGFYATDYKSPGKCGKDKPCCGRDEPCGKKECDD